jgi:hypothetical protein
MQRVLKPGGTLALALGTPNIPNFTSRISYLINRLYNLYGPLHVGEGDLHNAGGHINPVSRLYLTHSSMDAGFKRIEVIVDKNRELHYLASLYEYFLSKYPQCFTC